jgi:hypothetical protein
LKGNYDGIYISVNQRSVNINILQNNVSVGEASVAYVQGIHHSVINERIDELFVQMMKNINETCSWSCQVPFMYIKNAFSSLKTTVGLGKSYFYIYDEKIVKFIIYASDKTPVYHIIYNPLVENSLLKIIEIDISVPNVQNLLSILSPDSIILFCIYKISTFGYKLAIRIETGYGLIGTCL